MSTMFAMQRHWYYVLFLMVILCLCGVQIASAQIEMPVLHEIHLPIPVSRGSFGGGFWAISVPSYDRFAVRLLPDQRLLVMNPNSTGQWSLNRIGRWWTDVPDIESLTVPGWTEANLQREQEIRTGMLVTPTGDYAVIISGVETVKDADRIPFAPDHSIAGKHDTFIALIDLKKWQVIRGFHSAILGEYDFRRAQIVGGKWLALEGYNRTPSRENYAHLYERVNQLISLPDLEVGPKCFTTISDSLIMSPMLGERPAADAKLAAQNNLMCAELLKATGLTSVYRFESLMFLGEEPAPETYQPYSQFPRRFSTGVGTIDERNFNHREMVGRDRGFGFTPEDDDFYHYNPPSESRAGYWYEFQHPEGTHSYYLGRYDNTGVVLALQPTNLQARTGCRNNYCNCRVEYVREDASSLLAYCRVYTVDFVGAHHRKKQWLTVFTIDDLSEGNDVRLSNDHLTKQVMAVIDGVLYVLVVERGEILRVYKMAGAPALKH